MNASTKVRPASVSRGRYRRTQELADTILDIVNVQFADLSMSTRQIFYQVVSRGALPNSSSSYDKVQRLVVDLREEDEIAWERVVDRTRAMHRRAGWDGPIEVMNAVSKQYRRDLWAEQDTVVMIACEKQALEGIFSEVVDEYGASLWTLRGYGSATFLHEWANEIFRLFEEQKAVVVYYFGDWDPTGLDIERHARETLASHLERKGWEPMRWSRNGLCYGDFLAYDLVNVEIKSTDTRAKKFIEANGHNAAELDALPPDELQSRIRDAIKHHIDVAAWNRLADIERVERESINVVVKNWETAVNAARGAA